MFPFTKLRVIDHCESGLSFSPMESFAYDDTFTKLVGHHESLPTIRSWVHRPTVVLGIQDSKLPHLDCGLEFLHRLGYDVIIRNSGGLSVVLDEGILNVSLIVKEDDARSIDDGFEYIVALIKKSFQPYTDAIEAKEIVGSYCPGKYDLSINGKKFAGISQRRIQGGVCVQIYIAITGRGDERAKIISEFYDCSIQGERTKIVYPKIVPETMASLNELIDPNFTVETIWKLLLTTIESHGIQLIHEQTFTKQEEHLFLQYKERMMLRNEKFL